MDEKWFQRDVTARSIAFAFALIAGVGISLYAWASVMDPFAEGHFRKYLAECKPEEVRCLWVSPDNASTAKIMTIHLTKRTTYTATDMFNWAEQSPYGTRHLTPSQTRTVKSLIAQLPPSDDVGYSRSLFISIYKDGKVQTFHYDRRRPPPQVIRIYDIGGGELNSAE